MLGNQLQHYMLANTDDCRRAALMFTSKESMAELSPCYAQVFRKLQCNLKQSSTGGAQISTYACKHHSFMALLLNYINAA